MFIATLIGAFKYLFFLKLIRPIRYFTCNVLCYNLLVALLASIIEPLNTLGNALDCTNNNNSRDLYEA
ncbi:hypothetical protein HanXRQr2_Chr01g0024741 [Helianthus annuus]|uniref:Uncharacterized protein n=1 Tax=Helianthus annuus TaxID=4232 RepID=A0A9K3JW51_HELAN|nr:hypothetical protein HanXRQr2_Chr01g0024741 [Helianthus annuus]KAJ0839713.1 hypothetical protein HanPSC8_Chr14g0610121 [Helianthus annuus]